MPQGTGSPPAWSGLVTGPQPAEDGKGLGTGREAPYRPRVCHRMKTERLVLAKLTYGVDGVSVRCPAAERQLGYRMLPKPLRSLSTG